MIGIRADVNKTIATGHFMRCLSIAQGIRNSNEVVIFISADDGVKMLAEQYQFQNVQLGTRWDDMDSEVDRLKEIIDKYHINKLLIDSYYVTEQYFERLSDCVELIYIDDLNKFKYGVDCLINYNIYFDNFNYDEVYKGTETKLLLGPQYVPLRSEFKGVKRNVNDTVCDILITTGGTDTFGAAGRIAKELIGDKEMVGINIHIVAGLYSRLYDETGLNSHPNVFIHRNVKNMSELMKQCDIGVTAGGSTLYELCASGLPSVTFSLADNQLFGCEAFDRMSLMPYSGDVRKDMDGCMARIISNIKYYAKDFKTRKDRSLAMQSLVDGYGADRIVSYLLG